MPDQTSFDIINVQPYSGGEAAVLARSVRAENRTYALLRFVRDQFQVTPDVLSMYDEEYESEEPCGCLVRVSFGKVQAKRLHGWITGDRTPSHAEVQRVRCSEHVRSPAVEWEGFLEAWAHKPGRQSRFEI
jgi:hypothetical protein